MIEKENSKRAAEQQQAQSEFRQFYRSTSTPIPMTYEQMLQQRLQALLKTIEVDTTSDLLVAEFQRIHEECTRIQEERQWK